MTANREGFISSIGYLSLYLAGVSWGRSLTEKTSGMKDKVRQLGIIGNRVV
jgi:hypothetical protein